MKPCFGFAFFLFTLCRLQIKLRLRNTSLIVYLSICLSVHLSVTFLTALEAVASCLCLNTVVSVYPLQAHLFFLNSIFNFFFMCSIKNTGTVVRISIQLLKIATIFFFSNVRPIAYNTRISYDFI